MSCQLLREIKYLELEEDITSWTEISEKDPNNFLVSHKCEHNKYLLGDLSLIEENRFLQPPKLLKRDK